MQKWIVEYACSVHTPEGQEGYIFYHSAVRFDNYKDAEGYFYSIPLGVNDAIYLEYCDDYTADVLAVCKHPAR